MLTPAAEIELSKVSSSEFRVLSVEDPRENKLRNIS